MGGTLHTACWRHCGGRWLSLLRFSSIFPGLRAQEHSWKVVSWERQGSRAAWLGVWTWGILSGCGPEIQTDFKQTAALLDVDSFSVAWQSGTKPGSLPSVFSTAPRLLFWQHASAAMAGRGRQKEETLGPLSLLGWKQLFFYLCWHSKHLFKVSFEERVLLLKKKKKKIWE